jgi:hypothetical protein
VAARCFRPPAPALGPAPPAGRPARRRFCGVAFICRPCHCGRDSSPMRLPTTRYADVMARHGQSLEHRSNSTRSSPPANCAMQHTDAVSI